MSGPRAVSDLLAAWTRGLTNNEHESLNVLYQAIAEAIRRGQKVPPSIDRRCMALVVQKLEEAEHWALQALRIAVDREDEQRDILDLQRAHAENCICVACSAARAIPIGSHSPSCKCWLCNR